MNVFCTHIVGIPNKTIDMLFFDVLSIFFLFVLTKAHNTFILYEFAVAKVCA